MQARKRCGQTHGSRHETVSDHPLLTQDACCSGRSEVVNIAPHVAGVGRFESCCGSTASCAGSDYRVVSASISKIQSWSTSSYNGCCTSAVQVGFKAGSISAAAALDDGLFATQFSTPLTALMAASRGLKLSPTPPVTLPGSQKICGRNSEVLRVGAAGDVVLSTHSSDGCCNETVTEVGGFLQDLTYVGYQRPSECSRACCCKPAIFELWLKGGSRFYMETDDAVGIL